MKKSFTFLLIVIPLNLFAQGFNSIHSPDGVNVFAVGDSGKIYRSSNSGNGWYIYNYTSNNFKSVFSLGSDVWFAGDLGKIYKTNISISSINVINLGVDISINSILFTNSNIGYLCGDSGKVFKSINGGFNWSLINSGITNDNLNSISFKDSQNGIVVGNNGKVYTTNNGGLSWTAEPVFSNKKLLKVKYFMDGICIVGEYGNLILKTDIFSWAQVNTKTNSDIRGVSGLSINEAHICGGGGFIRNNKMGSSNFFNFEINPMLANLVDIFYYNSNLGFAVSSLNKAVIKTTNGGFNWNVPTGTSVNFSWVQKSPSGSGIGNNLCMHPYDRNSAFVVYGNKVYVSRDKGNNWNQIAIVGIGSRAHSFYVSPVDTNIWVAAMENSPDCIARSTDYGVTWTNIIALDFSTYGQPLEMDQNDPHNFYFAPSNGSGIGVYKSTDVGATFNLVAPYNNSGINQPCDLIIKWGQPNEIYLGDDGADIWKSTNAALTWTLVKPGSSSEVPSMCNSVFDNNICYATTWSSPQVYRTTNSGDNWSVVSNNSGSGWASDLCREDPSVVMTGNYGAQAFLTTNGGANFFNINTGLSGAGAGMMVPDRANFLNMQTGSLYKLNIAYSVLDSNIYIPLPSQTILLNLKVFPEGFYFALFDQLSRKDTFSVYLRNVQVPYSLVDSAKGVIDSLSLSGVFNFYTAPSGTYFIIVKHINSLETWSKTGGIYLNNDSTIYNYDFSTSNSQAFGNNLVLKEGKYCLFGGDVNQDGYINLSDVLPIYNDAINFVSGRFLATDLTGNNTVDLTDVTLCYNNSVNFVRVKRP